MKKKLVAILTAATMMVAFVPGLAMATGNPSKSVKVTFSAGTESHVDAAMEDITASADTAEKYFPEIKDNEPEGVSFADVITQAHVEKYGADKVKDYLQIDNSQYGTSMAKLYGHAKVGFYYVNDKALQIGVSEEVKDGDSLFAGAYEDADANWAAIYGKTDKKTVNTTPGKEVTLKVDAVLFDGSTAVPDQAEVNLVSVKDEKLTPVKGTYKDGKVTFSLKDAGEQFVYVTGKVTYEGFYGKTTGGLAGALAKINVKLAKTKITSKKAGKKKATLKWKKVAGAKKYQVFMSSKKKGKFKKAMTVKTTKATVKKLKKGKAYYFKVRACAKNAGKEINGAFSKTVKIKVK